MPSTALPVRVTPEGKLEQQETLDATLELVRAMAATTATTWPHAPWFGLLELFEEASKREKQEHEALKDALNTAFDELGAEYRVQSVVSGTRGGDGRRGFQLTFVDRGGKSFFGEVATA